MRKCLTLFITFLLASGSMKAQQLTDGYDSALAKKLKADDYGMKNYILVLLKPGSNSVDKVTEDSIFNGHLNNIGRLANEGKLVLAGPFGKNDLYRGLFILNVISLEEANNLLATDPAIKAKLLEPEMYLWYGTAALQEITPLHKKLQKISF